MFEIVNPPNMAVPQGYSHGIKAAGETLLFLAGQVAWDKERRVVGEGDFVAQFDKALENLVAVVREAGGKPEDVTKLTLFVTDKQQYLARLREVGEAYRKHMGRHFPAMTLVQVADLLDEGILIEIEGMAVLSRA